MVRRRRICPAKRDSRHSYYTKVHHRPPINAHPPECVADSVFNSREVPLASGALEPDLGF